MQAEQLLIQKISSRPSTEDLIFFIAQDDAMTSVCAELHKKIAGNKREELKEINLYCQKYHISLAYLSRELDHIQNIFSPRKVFSGDHEILGLQTDASLAQVKHAFRKLCLQYHPDTSNKNNTEKFIKITKAYQRIINNTDKKESRSSSATTWRYRKENSPFQGQNRKKIYLYLFSFISTVLLLVIVGLSIHYQRRAMLNNISKKKSAITRTTATVATQEQSLQPLLEQPPPSLIKETGQKAEEQVPGLAVAGVTKVTNNRANDHPPPVTSVLPEKTTTLAQSSTSQRTVALNVKNHTPPSSLAPHQSQTKAAMNKKYSDRLTDKPIAGKKEDEKKKSAHLVQKIFPKKTKELVVSKQTANSLPLAEPTEPSEPSEKSYQAAIVTNVSQKKVEAKEEQPPVKKVRKKSQTTSVRTSIRKSLRAFVKSYISAYAARDLQQFSLFFTNNAVENGVPFSTVRHKYRQLFTTTKGIEYGINILGTDIQEKGTKVILTGRFRVRLVYSPSKINANSGTITFFLAKKQKNYKITALTYQLDPKK
ncbi:MAG: hypothetical protein D3912_08330 [Candidatus Electrothrix sp. AX1]|nr:hypothetical protein [Candidatus Electrothrix sp. AX1]